MGLTVSARQIVKEESSHLIATAIRFDQNLLQDRVCRVFEVESGNGLFVIEAIPGCGHYDL